MSMLLMLRHADNTTNYYKDVAWLCSSLVCNECARTRAFHEVAVVFLGASCDQLAQVLHKPLQALILPPHRHTELRPATA